MHRTIVTRQNAVLAGLACWAMLGSGAAAAVQSCALDGVPVNPDNGYTTQGKSGLMRCRDGESGPILREQELKNGVFMGAVRYYSGGVLEREHRVNERGNRDGLSREYAASPGAAKPALVREDTYRDGKTVGLARTWYPAGGLKRVSFHDDDREQAVAEFNAQGQLSDLRCGPRPLLGPDADDARWCGHLGGPSLVPLYNGKGQPKARVAYERGERRRFEGLGDNGAVRELQETTASGGLERTFGADGVKRRETQWAMQAGSGSERGRRVITLEQEFHESGKLVHEKRFKSAERGAEALSEQRWYLNGQPRSLIEFMADNGRALRRDTAFHDNGRKASEELYLLPASGGRGREQPTGVQRSWDSDGHLRSERIFDEAGRIKRERELDGNGVVVRDDEVFEDGSRKAYGK